MARPNKPIFRPEDYQRWYWTRFPHASMPYADAIAGEFGGSSYSDLPTWKMLLLSGLVEKDLSARTDSSEQPLNASMENLFRQIYGRPMSATEKSKLRSIPGIDFSGQRAKDNAKMIAEGALWALPGTGPVISSGGKLVTKGAMKLSPHIGAAMSKAGGMFTKTGKAGEFVVDNVGDQFVGIGIDHGIESSLRNSAAYRGFIDNPKVSQQVKDLINQRAHNRYYPEQATGYNDSLYHLAGDIPGDKLSFDYFLGNPSVNYRKYNMNVLSDEGEKFYRDYILSNQNELKSNYIPGENLEEFYTRTTGSHRIPKGEVLRPKHGIPMTPGSFVLPEMEKLPAEKGFYESYLPSKEKHGKIQSLYNKLPEGDRKIIESRIKSGYAWFNPASSQHGFYSTGELMTRDFGESGELDLNDDGFIYLNGKKIDLSKLNEQQLQTLQFHINDNGSNISRESNKRAYEQKTGNFREVKKNPQNIPSHKVTMDNAHSDTYTVESDEWKKGFSGWVIKNNQHLKNIQKELDNRFPLNYKNVRAPEERHSTSSKGLNPSEEKASALEERAVLGEVTLKDVNFMDEESQQDSEKK